MVGVNTLVPNRLVFQAAVQGLVPELQGYASVTAEVSINPRTRLDLKLEHTMGPDCYIEVKNCTLVTRDRPLSPTPRPPAVKSTSVN